MKKDKNSTREETTEWYIKNVPKKTIDKDLRLYLFTHHVKLYEFVTNAVKEKLERENSKKDNK